MNITVTRPKISQLDVLVNLFDSYRMFYGQGSARPGSRKFLAERIERQDSVLFLATDESTGRGLGFAQLYPSFSSVAMKRIWILNDLFVDENARRRGAARRLVAEIADFAAASGASRVELATARENRAAKCLYESIGFKLDTVFDHYKLSLS